MFYIHIYVHTYTYTVIAQYLSAAELIKPGTCRIFTRKLCFSTWCLLATHHTCMNHTTTPQEKMLPQSDADPGPQDLLLWLQYANTHGLQKSCGEKGAAWLLSK